MKEEIAGRKTAEKTGRKNREWHSRNAVPGRLFILADARRSSPERP